MFTQLISVASSGSGSTSSAPDTVMQQQLVPHRVSGLSVVLHSCSGIISPKPLNRVTDTPGGSDASAEPLLPPLLLPLLPAAAPLLPPAAPASAPAAAAALELLVLALLPRLLLAPCCCWPAAAAAALPLLMSDRIAASPASS